MSEKFITDSLLESYGHSLMMQEKSEVTVEKYMRDVRKFCDFVGDEAVTKENVMAYKDALCVNYAVRSVNSMLAGLNSFLKYMGLGELRVKSLRSQNRVYCPEEKELTRDEYYRLLKASEDNPRLNLIMQSICSTGIRVSELKYFTVEAARRGEAEVTCKGKIRTVLIPAGLCRRLMRYAKKNGIASGSIFLAGNGLPLSRTRIWAMMKALCVKAGVDERKVFPHNLRKLFARTFYAAERDIALLADILGHTSINTTRIYIMRTSVEHRRKMEKLGLVV